MCKTAVGLVLVAVVLVQASAAMAGIISIAGDTNALARGSQMFMSPSPSDGASQLYVEVQYAVYAPGTFDDTFAALGFTYASGTESHYFYAYEIFNNQAAHPWPTVSERDYVLWLTVGLPASSGAGNPGYISTDASQRDPSYEFVSPAGTFSAKWKFGSATAPTLNFGGVSDVLYFTSPYGPAPWTVTAAGNLSDTQYLPSPMPEPASLTILAIGLGGTLLMRRRRV